MRLLNLHTAPTRRLIKIRTFIRKDDFYIAKTNSLCDVLKVLHLATFSEIWLRYTIQDDDSDH